jgi:mono/diheme cytochrome c family protein
MTIAATSILALPLWPAGPAVAQSPADAALVQSPADPAAAKPSTNLAVLQSPSARRGLRFVRMHCAQCHAIDRASPSPLAMAPPLRTLHLKYVVADLQRPLAQGIHPMMPLFRLEPDQVEDVMTYLRTLQR